MTEQGWIDITGSFDARDRWLELQRLGRAIVRRTATGWFAKPVTCMDRAGFTRTRCACEDCVKCCKRQPGPLAPGDFERIAAFLGETHEQARKHFVASPGALVKNLITGKTQRIGSITPDYRRGRCVFLGPDDRCTIHPVAPAGCAYFDTHMGAAEAQERGREMVSVECDPDYQLLRCALPAARHYKPTDY